MNPRKGDMVRLAGSVMLAEFGLMLCDDTGDLLEIDGVVQEVMNDRVRVVIKRMMPRPAPFAWIEGHSSRWVRAEEVLGVIEGEAMLWPDAARLKGVSDEKGGVETGTLPIFWRVVVDKMTAGTTRWWGWAKVYLDKSWTHTNKYVQLLLRQTKKYYRDKAINSYGQ